MATQTFIHLSYRSHQVSYHTCSYSPGPEEPQCINIAYVTHVLCHSGLNLEENGLNHDGVHGPSLLVNLLVVILTLFMNTTRMIA